MGAQEFRKYLGDGVYCYYDGFGLWLTTGSNKISECYNKIYFEPEVLLKLQNILDKIDEARGDK